MNVTFLIGNGFDLACGMKTSYPDVYEEYIKTASNSDVIARFKQNLIDEKTKEKWGNWSDFEMGMARYAKTFQNEGDFIECVSDFKSFLEKHLKKEEKQLREKFIVFNSEMTAQVSRYIKNCVSNFYQGVSKKISRNIENIEKNTLGKSFSFISFNYTSIFENVIKKFFNQNYSISYIHGSLAENDVILGVDNVEQVSANFNLTKKIKRTFIKPFFNEEYDDNKLNQVKNNILNSDCICVFGLSLGDSDLMWKNLIIEWVKSNSENHLFLYDYTCSQINIVDASAKMNEEETQKEIKLKEFGFNINDEYFEQIHMPIGKKMFDIEPFLKMVKVESNKNKTA